MYSANGRKKGSKEAASKDSGFKSTLICNNCGHTEDNKSAVFGEKLRCTKCASIEVRFEYK